jgi:hypothetical protein
VDFSPVKVTSPPETLCIKEGGDSPGYNSPFSRKKPSDFILNSIAGLSFSQDVMIDSPMRKYISFLMIWPGDIDYYSDRNIRNFQVLHISLFRHLSCPCRGI